jgi:two-component system, cell cycle sensor histidine kinase and response regulator CckA
MALDIQKILIVDDKPANLFALEQILKECPAETVRAVDGNKALIASLNHDFALAILDVEMPEMDGYELAELLRSEEKTRNLPIIFVSAVYSSDYHVFKGYDSGAVDFLVKPYHPKVLISKINIFLQLDRQKRLLKESRDSLAYANDVLETRVRERTADLEEAIQELQAEVERRKQAEAYAQKAKKDWQEIFEAIGHMAMILDKDYTIVAANRAILEKTGLPLEKVVGQKCYRIFHGIDMIAEKCPMAGMLSSDNLCTTEAEIAALGRNYIVSCTPILDDNGQLDKIIHIATDITRREQLEKELFQAQKMESVGQLAGGVAHDYNNMLSVILGYSELALKKVDPADSLHEDLLEIHKAAARSADITRQLLAFARKQTILPVALDLNVAVESILKMLHRLIGEDIDLAWLPETDLWPVKMDPSQVDQVLANLCLNARDAIEGVGHITIETKNSTFDDAYCADHSDFHPGDYVLLAVTDDGSGMDHDTINKIFEPFFTTKAVGQGTGLGLATVYGIVKQNSGFINVYSEPGKGTTFKIYLTRQSESSLDLAQKDPEECPMGHGEIILVVEDEASILKLARRHLESIGYMVLTAERPSQALLLVEEPERKIDLLITDVVMPEMNGKELSERLGELCPGLKTLYMSGYTANAIAHHGVLDDNVTFMQKPFSRESVAVKVREALDA